MDADQQTKKQNFSFGEEEYIAQETGKLKIACHRCGQKLDVTSCEPFSVVACPHCRTSLIVPRWFDSYLLEEIVGEGGMATVYRALDPALDREVAVKVLRLTDETDENFRELFLREARTAASINHQAVIAVYTCAVAEDSPYIVMEYMGGGSLEKILEKNPGKLDILQVCKWILDVAGGLERAARHGIIHHDIKPANIMMDSDGNVKIGDFGIAQKRFEKFSSLPGTENAWGSPFYVSPEKAKDGTESFSGDIYSLGAAFYHLLTGVPPFHEYEDLEELVYARIDKEPLPPSAIRKDIPGELSLIVMNMMARDPRMRPGYQEIRASLASFIKNAEKTVHSAPESYENVSSASGSGSEGPEGKKEPAFPEKNENISGREEKAIPEENKGSGRFTALRNGITGIFVAAVVFILSFLFFRMLFSFLKG